MVKPDIKDILDLNNVLFFNHDGVYQVLGKIKDVIGNILCPYYQILADSYLDKFIKSSQLKTGTKIYYLPSFSKPIQSRKLEKLRNEKAYDAVYEEN